MRFTHIRAYGVRGVTLRPGEGSVTLVERLHDGLRAQFCEQSDNLLQELDRRTAVADVALDTGLGGRADGTIDERLAAAITAERESRERRFGRGPYLLLERIGTVESFDTSRQVEHPDFVMCLDGYPGRPAEGISDQIADSLIASVALSVDGLQAVTPAGDAVVFFRDDGKRVYSLSFSMSASLTVASPIASEAISDVAQWFERLGSEPGLRRVVHLLVSSLALGDDRLRAFLSAWSALEILVSKLFAYYERRFFDAIVSASSPAGQRQHMGRIREVMKSKYRLGDRFALLASQLDPTSSDADIVSFSATKKQRDDLLHGDEIDERQLRLLDAQRLARKYLRLHLEQRPSASPP
jgi:hypothetical protein